MHSRVVRRKETPDFNRFLKVVRRQGDRSYVPFWEMVVDRKHFEPVSGLPLPPGGLEFGPASPRFEASFAYYLKWCACVGFDLGIINLPGFGGFPARRHGVENPARGFIMSADSVINNEADFDAYPWPSAKTVNVEVMQRLAKGAPEGLAAEADEAAGCILEAMDRQEGIYECYDALTGTGNGHPEFMWSAAAVLALAHQLYRRDPVGEL